jgi:hypothetical protein
MGKRPAAKLFFRFRAFVFPRALASPRAIVPIATRFGNHISGFPWHFEFSHQTQQHRIDRQYLDLGYKDKVSLAT